MIKSGSNASFDSHHKSVVPLVKHPDTRHIFLLNAGIHKQVGAKPNGILPYIYDTQAIYAILRPLDGTLLLAI
jgi:hypothetical protein